MERMRRSQIVVAFLVLVGPASSLRAEDSPGSEARVAFRTDVIAALSRAGCNSGACHGSPQGKNGFRLSLRGGDPDLDFSTLTKDQGGRRIDRVSPEDSLFLLKGTGRVSHQGGAVLGRDSAAYKTLVRWVAEGGRDEKTSPLVKLELTPAAARLAKPEQQITVKARFEDGTSRDVTDLTVFTAADMDASVTPGGLVTFHRTAEASILARYLQGITAARLTFVQPDPSFAFRSPPAANFIDELVFAKQKELQLLPSAVCSDEVFLRRVFLDAIGTLPTRRRGPRVPRLEGYG
jgi:hypothetical protein